jgi:hypothetical protein
LRATDDDLPSAGEILIQPATVHVLELHNEEPRRRLFAAFIEANSPTIVLNEKIFLAYAGSQTSIKIMRLFCFMMRIYAGWNFRKVHPGGDRVTLVLNCERSERRP